MTTLVVDAYDSFVYVIAQYLAVLGAEPVVLRNDVVTADVVDELAPDAILLGPGPGHPADAGYVEIVRHVGGRIPIMGVCLGHQAIGLAFGGRIGRAQHLMHGKTSVIAHNGRGCFAGMPEDLVATRYHSLIVEEVPPELEVSATARDDGYVMGMRHRTMPIESVQFHPESHETADGIRLFSNFFASYVPHAAGVALR